jgi:OOP family OmpA-OmpF porin
MKKFAASLLTFAALSSAAVPAFSGERAGAVSISPFVGGYTFDGVQHLKTSPVYGLRLGYDVTRNLGIEAVGNFLETQGTHADTSINALSYRLDILYNIMPHGPFVPYLAAGGGGIIFGHGRDGLKFSDRTNDITATAGFGVKYFLSDSIALRGDARQLFIFEDHNSVMYNWEYTAGLSFLFGGKKTAAPAQLAPALVEPPAAPPSPTSKLSVVPGSIKKGETTTLKWTSRDATDCSIYPGIGQVQPQGSVKITPATDTDYRLSCNGPGGTSTSAANVLVAGTPLPAARPVAKSSLSAVPASIRKGESATLSWTSQNAANCTIRPVIGAVQPQGSMIVAPAEDSAYTLSCKGAGGVTTSTANVAVTIPPPVVQASRPMAAARLCSPTLIDIQFATGTADIMPQYYSELKKLADFLKEFSGAKGVIAGHTDNVGGKASNMKLSRKRADSVRSYLIKTFAIAPERIKAVGYGPTKPVSSNKTAEGRAKNRRIEADFNCE